MTDGFDYDAEDGVVCPRCMGDGSVECRCGGDLCICENYGERVVVVEYIPPPSSRTPESWRTVPGRWEFRPTHWTAIAPPSPAPDKEG